MVSGNRYLPRSSNENTLCITSTCNVSVARWVIPLVTILLLDLVMIHWIRWIQGNSFRENSIVILWEHRSRCAWIGTKFSKSSTQRVNNLEPVIVSGRIYPHPTQWQLISNSPVPYLQYCGCCYGDKILGIIPAVSSAGWPDWGRQHRCWERYRLFPECLHIPCTLAYLNKKQEGISVES